MAGKRSPGGRVCPEPARTGCLLVCQFCGEVGRAPAGVGPGRGFLGDLLAWLGGGRPRQLPGLCGKCWSGATALRFYRELVRVSRDWEMLGERVAGLETAAGEEGEAASGLSSLAACWAELETLRRRGGRIAVPVHHSPVFYLFRKAPAREMERRLKRIGRRMNQMQRCGGDDPGRDR